MNTYPSLLKEFPEHSYEQWHDAAEALLKGAPFEKRLVSQTYEDITIQPIYRREDIAGLEHRKHLPGFGSLVRGSKPEGFLNEGWGVSQELKAPNAIELNSQVHEALNGGQSELNILVGCGQQECCTGGASLTKIDDFKTALNGVALDAVSTYWQCGPSSIPVASLFLAAASNMGFSPSSLRGGFENDPLAELVTKGALRHSLALRFDHMAALTQYATKHAPQLTTITVTGDAYHNAGASATQELGYIMATLVTYIEKMKASGLSVENVLPHIRIRVAVGSDYFMEIAKIRATRWLWSKVTSAYGVPNAPVHIHASTSKWNKTTYDAHTNMLRVTAEAFAAVVAGVDSLHIGTYDEVAGKSDTISRRISRNLHTILREECGLDQVIDPAGGSNYIEWLTDQIAAQGWEIFQGIEKQGGIISALENGSIQKEVAAVQQAKFKNIRLRKDKIVGANMYPDLKGKKVEAPNVECTAKQAAAAAPKPEDLEIIPSAKAHMVEQAIAAAMVGASKSSIAHGVGLTNPEKECPTVTALPAHRAAEEYEALRDASALFEKKTGSAPSILQLNMGPSRNYRLRADWTASFFEAAGFAVDGTRDFSDEAEALTALTQSKASIAVITSDDDTYLKLASSLAQAVKKQQPEITLILAGAAGEHDAAWREAGIDDFVNVRSNNYEMNEALLRTSGVLS